MAEQSRRKLKNILLHPSFQLRYIFYFAGCSLTVMAGMYYLIAVRINAVSKLIEISEMSGIPTELSLSKILVEITLITLFAFLSNSILTFIAGLWITHRVAGPAKKIQLKIRNLINGEYTTDTSLRKNDDLSEVMADLNELSEKLKNEKLAH